MRAVPPVETVVRARGATRGPLLGGGDPNRRCGVRRGALVPAGNQEIDEGTLDCGGHEGE